MAQQHQHDADDPREDHRRHHDELEQPVLHHLEGFRLLGAGFARRVIDEQRGR